LPSTNPLPTRSNLKIVRTSVEYDAITWSIRWWRWTWWKVHINSEVWDGKGYTGESPLGYYEIFNVTFTFTPSVSINDLILFLTKF